MMDIDLKKQLMILLLGHNSLKITRQKFNFIHMYKNKILYLLTLEENQDILAVVL